MKLIVDRVAFSVPEDDSTVDGICLNQIPFKKATLKEGVSEVTVYAKKLNHSAIDAGILKLQPISGLHSTISFEVGNPSTSLGTFSGLQIRQGSTIMFELKEKQLKISTEEETSIQKESIDCSSSKLNYSAPVRVNHRYYQTSGNEYSSESSIPDNFIIEELSSYPFTRVKWHGSNRSLEITVGEMNQKIVLIEDIFSVAKLEFLDEKTNEKGKRKVSPVLLKGSTLFYPQLRDNSIVELKEHSFIFFDKTDKLKLEEVTLQQDSNGEEELEVHLSGEIRKPLVVSPSGLTKLGENVKLKDKGQHDLRLTSYELLVNGSLFWKILMDFILWVIPIMLSIGMINKVKIVS
jgi:hypothetical protein